MADAVLAREQSRLETEQNRVRSLLQKAQLHACEIDEALDEALTKTKTPHATYLASSPLEQRLLNQAFFKRILVGENNEVVGATLTPVYAALAAWGGEPRTARPKDRAARRTGARTRKPQPPSSGPGFTRRTYGGDGGNRTHVRSRV